MLSQYKSVCNNLKSHPIKHVYSNPFNEVSFCIFFFSPQRQQSRKKNNINPENKNPNKMQHHCICYKQTYLFKSKCTGTTVFHPHHHQPQVYTSLINRRMQLKNITQSLCLNGSPASKPRLGAFQPFACHDFLQESSIPAPKDQYSP